MTPAEITDASRTVTNTQNSNFVSDSELLNYLNFGLREASHYARCVESVDVYTSIASTQTYTITASAFEIKQIEYSGLKVRPVTFREAQAANYTTLASNVAGSPAYYYRWGNDVVFFPMPSASDDTIKIYSYSTHPTITASGTILVPETLQHYLVDYVAYRILQKEQNFDGSQNYYNVWRSNLELMKREMFQKQRSDSFRQVQTEETLVYGPFGIQ